MIDKQSRTGKEDQGKAKTMMFLKKLRCAKDPLINPINPHVVVVFVDHHIQSCTNKKTIRISFSLAKSPFLTLRDLAKAQPDLSKTNLIALSKHRYGHHITSSAPLLKKNLKLFLYMYGSFFIYYQYSIFLGLTTRLVYDQC